MPVYLDNQDAGFQADFAAFLGARRQAGQDVAPAVAAIVAEIRARGDEALIEYTAKFDRLELSAATMRISADEISAAVTKVDRDTLDALAFAHRRIHDHHKRQIPRDERYSDAGGVELGHCWHPIDAAGLYVPGGLASYPSSVLMNSVPAIVAGVKRLVMMVPAPDGVLDPLVLASANLAGVDEIYRVGGAQAIAALAYGTQTIAAVDKIVGPGNAYVAEAKRLVFGTVGIDMIAGPSEVLVIADGANNPDWIASDLLAQAEHDRSAQSILITDDRDFAGQIDQAVKRQLTTLPRADIAAASWRNHGAVIVVASLDQAVELANKIAPEHLELACDVAEQLLTAVRNAGAVFLGRYTPEAIGDYVGGTNHVLPTAGSARFSSGLSVLDFMKRTSILKCGVEQLQALAPAAELIAGAEGLDAHRRSVSIRLN